MKTKPQSWRGFCKSLRGFRFFRDTNPAIDEYHAGLDAEYTIRLMFGLRCLIGAGIRPDDDRWGTGAAVFLIINNHGVGVWRDPQATPWAAEYEGG